MFQLEINRADFSVTAIASLRKILLSKEELEIVDEFNDRIERNSGNYSTIA